MKTANRPKTKWIDIKDDLPEYDREVLLFMRANYGNPYVKIGSRTFTDKHGEHFGITSNRSCEAELSPTHWMPLPEFP